MDAMHGSQINWHFEKSCIESSELAVESKFGGPVGLEVDLSLSKMSESSFSFSFESVTTCEPEALNEDVISAYFSMPIVHNIDKTFINLDKNEKEEIPRALKNLIDWEEERRAKPLVDERFYVNVGTKKDPRLIQIGSTLSSEERDQLVALFLEFKFVFVLSFDDMPVIDSDIL